MELEVGCIIKCCTPKLHVIKVFRQKIISNRDLKNKRGVGSRTYDTTDEVDVELEVGHNIKCTPKLCVIKVFRQKITSNRGLKNKRGVGSRMCDATVNFKTPR